MGNALPGQPIFGGTNDTDDTYMDATDGGANGAHELGDELERLDKLDEKLIEARDLRGRLDAMLSTF